MKKNPLNTFICSTATHRDTLLDAQLIIQLQQNPINDGIMQYIHSFSDSLEATKDDIERLVIVRYPDNVEYPESVEYPNSDEYPGSNASPGSVESPESGESDSFEESDSLGEDSIEEGFSNKDQVVFNEEFKEYRNEEDQDSSEE